MCEINNLWSKELTIACQSREQYGVLSHLEVPLLPKFPPELRSVENHANHPASEPVYSCSMEDKSNRSTRE